MNSSPALPADARSRGEALRTQLRARPVRNERLTIRPGPDGGLEVTVPLTYPAAVRALRRTLAIKETKTWRLDAAGARLFRSLDGRRDVESLIDAFAAEHRLTFFEARALVAQTLLQFTQRGLIALVSGEAEEGAEKP